MIQRKQTIFLLLAAITLIVAATMNTGTMLMLVILLAAALLCVADIFIYKKRKLQAQLTLPIMVLLLAWYVLLAVSQEQIVLQHLSELAQSNGGDTLQVADMKEQSSVIYVWPNALPLLALLLTFMARKGILRDEKLVRSLDRIR